MVCIIWFAAMLLYHQLYVTPVEPAQSGMPRIADWDETVD